MTTKEEYTYSPVAGKEETEVKYDVENNEVNIPTKMSKSAVPTNRKFLYIAACVGNLSAFVCGTAFGWTSPELPKLKGTPDAGNPLDAPITKGQESWIGSFLPVGATFGPFLAGLLADRIGRKPTLLLGGLPFVAAFAVAAVAGSPLLFYLVRLLCGVGVGVVFTVLPMYIGEIAEDAVRDSLGSFMQLFIVIGLLFSYALGPYMTVTTFNLLCLLAPCCFLATFYFFIPESPYFLIRRDKAQAERALAKLRAKPQVQEELAEIKKSVEESLANRASFFDIFKSRGLTKALTLSVGLIAFQQFSGINIVLFYAQDIFTEAGTGASPELCTIAIGVMQVLASASTPLLVEKRGKRFLLLLSGVGMAAAQAALAAFFWVKKSGDASAIAWLPVVSLVAFIVTYCLGFGPLPWAVMGELFPGNVKSAASTATAAACWFLGFVLTKYFSVVTAAVGPEGGFGLFAACCAGAAAFVFVYLPDTSGKSLQEIQEILEGGK